MKDVWQGIVTAPPGWRAKQICGAQLCLLRYCFRIMFIAEPEAGSAAGTQRASTSVSPVRIRTAFSSGMTKILPSPI